MPSPLTGAAAAAMLDRAQLTAMGEGTPALDFVRLAGAVIEAKPDENFAAAEVSAAAAVRSICRRAAPRRVSSPAAPRSLDAGVPRWHALPMGAAEKLHTPATLADLEAVPPPLRAELIEGVLYTFPRPAPRHARTSGKLGARLDGPFDTGRGGPGGWVILPEPELHFPDPKAAGKVIAVAPDLAGWRRERMPTLPQTAHFELAPDWVCEVLSPSTERYDRDVKMPVYAREGVRHVWLVDPLERTLEVYELERGRWELRAEHAGEELVRAVPFDAVELELAALWAP